MSELKPSCPKCGSEQTSIERRINGKCYCQKCYHTWPNKRFEFDAVAAIAERDKRIKELEDRLNNLAPFESMHCCIQEQANLIVKMKCCGNCRHSRSNEFETYCTTTCCRDGLSSIDAWEPRT